MALADRVRKIVGKQKGVSEKDMFGLSHIRPMDFSGKPMKGFLYVSSKRYETDEQLKKWSDISLKFVSALPQKKKKR